jgi:spore coat polysaccharide biosynthesis predicted glycosyltransferase SpsG/RimJ/RimL family protein N-acetyltransferase
MRGVIFADGSPTIGRGHQVRMSALAVALARAGHDFRLVCRNLQGSAHPWAWAGLGHECLPAELTPDAAICRIVDSFDLDVLVVDHYGVSADRLSATGRLVRLVVVDDEASRITDLASLILNQAPGVMPSHYPSSPTMLGPRYALLRDEFAQAVRKHNENCKSQALVVLGSCCDLRALEELLAATALELVVVVPPGSPKIPGRSRLEWCAGPSATKLVSLMTESRLGFLSASSVAYEAACVGLPFVAIVTAQNQRLLARGLAEAGYPVVARDNLRDLSRHLPTLPKTRLSVDGNGAARVARRIIEFAIPTPGMRLAVWSDRDRLLEWANDEGTRRASFRSSKIAEGEHSSWLEARLADPEARTLMAERAGVPVGVLRLDRTASDATVSITVAPTSRAMGVGGTMLATASSWIRASSFARRLVARVRKDNLPSQALFAKAGYRTVRTEVIRGHEAFRMEFEI